MSNNLSRANLIQSIAACTTGGGFRRDIPLHQTNGFTAANAGALSSGGSPRGVVVSNIGVVSMQANNTGALGVQLTIPGDYDNADYNGGENEVGGDEAIITCFAAMAAGALSRVLTATAYRARAGEANAALDFTLDSDTFTVTATTVTIAGTTYAAFEINLSGNSLQAGDNLTVLLTPDNANENCYVQSGRFRYKSNLRITEDDES